jgi:WD40 repeat protein
MEALYNRMAYTITENPNSNHKRLAHDILVWTTCTRRLMMVGELSDVLGQDPPLNFQRSIGDLCGGFVVVDIEGTVALIHQTAREYLFSDLNRSLSIDERSANELLFQKCIVCLTDPGLRFKISRNQELGLLDYAVSSWFMHLCLSDAKLPHVLPTVLKFLEGPYVLTWIQAIAKIGKLQLLILASQHLNSFAAKLRELKQHTSPAERKITEREVIESWATDFAKILGKFVHNLAAFPQAIYKLIPPFCPHDSIIYQQFGQKEKKALPVSGFSTNCWDDCLGRRSSEQDTFTTAVLTAGNHIAILSQVGPLSKVFIHYASTFEEVRQIAHPERVMKIGLSNSGNLLLIYGYLTTRIWDLSTGESVKKVFSPRSRPWPLTLLFTDEENTVLVGSDDRRLHSLNLDGTSSEWEVVAYFDEQELEGTFVNSPTCMALSPQGGQIALGHQGHPVTLWEVNEPTPTGRYARTLDSFHQTAKQSWGEVMRLAWHPFSGEVLGLYLEGIIFKWQPLNDETKEANAGANIFVINFDGSLCATGDANGTLKVYSTVDFSLLYQLSSQDPILDLTFSKDSRRLYDVRGTYGNVWEPNTLVRLADNSEIIGRHSDSASMSGSFVTGSANPQHWFGKVDTVTAIGAQKSGSIYCYGTEECVLNLCEVGA